MSWEFGPPIDERAREREAARHRHERCANCGGVFIPASSGSWSVCSQDCDLEWRQKKAAEAAKRDEEEMERQRLSGDGRQIEMLEKIVKTLTKIAATQNKILKKLGEK